MPYRAPPWRGGASAESAPWVLKYHGFDPSQEGNREALCTLANGYLGTRGAAPECRADHVHYPGTYLAGVYDWLSSSINNAVVEDEHRVNAPNWFPLGSPSAAGTGSAQIPLRCSSTARILIYVARC
jgi:Glycosyl hydrolase family 65, N-terminal domain